MDQMETTAAELNRLGENLLKAGNADAAYEYFKQAEEQDPNDPASYINQGRVLLARADYPAAIEALAKALLADAENAEALFLMSGAHFLNRDLEKGLLFGAQAAEAGCRDPMLYMNMAAACEDLGRIDRAMRYYNKAIDAAPLEGACYTAKAECQIRCGRDSDALQTLALLHRNCPDSFEAYHYSYMIYVRQRDFEKAEEILSEGIRNFPGDPGLYVDMVHLLNITRHPQEALELLDALEQVKDSVQMDLRDIRLERAKAYVISERVADAKQLLEEVVQMEGARSFEAHYLLMNCCLSLEDFEEMGRVAELMTKADDESEFSRAARYYLPMSYMKRGLEGVAAPLYEEAIRYYRAQTLKHPEQTDAYLFRALCCKDLKRFDDALKVLDYLDKLVPQYQPCQMIRAAVYLEMGEKEKAQQAYHDSGSLKDALDDLVGPLIREE